MWFAPMALLAESPRDVAWRKWGEGRELVREKRWSEALATFDQAYRAHRFVEPSFYFAAIAAAGQSGDLDRAYGFLDRIAALGWVNVNRFESDPVYGPVVADARWPAYREKRAKAARELERSLDPQTLGLGTSRLETRAQKLAEDPRVSTAELPARLRGLQGFVQPRRVGVWVRFVNRYRHFDGTEWDQPYLVYIPKSYDARRRTPALLYSNGGWFGSPQFRSVLDQEFRYDNPPFDWVVRSGFIQIYPYGNQATATYQLNGIDNYRSILRAVKNVLNVDDDRVTFMGYSDGATGAYRTAAFQPSPYAAFVPVNGSVFTSNPISNYLNRPIFSLSAERDRLFPIESLRRFHGFAASVGARWEQSVVPGRDHEYWPFLTQYLPDLWAKIRRAKRNAIPRFLRWEAPSPVVGEVDWLSILAISTDQPRQPWHREFRFSATDEKGRSEEVAMNADTGMVEAKLVRNTFELRTSRVGRVRLRIDPRMVDLRQSVTVVANGRAAYRGPILPDRQYVLRQFLKDLDRGFVPCAEVEVDTSEKRN